MYLDGVPVVDVWTGWADRGRSTPWAEDTGTMVFSATKGMASTVIHRLVDRGLIDYDTPVAQYWPDFGANGKQRMTVREVMAHRGGLSRLQGLTKADVLDHRIMEQRIAAAPPGLFFGKSAYHAVTYGWILSGLARAVTGTGMRDLFRSELARPLDTDGLYLGRPPKQAPTRAAELITLKRSSTNRFVDSLAAKIAALPIPGLFGAIYFQGMRSVLQEGMPILDSEIPSANGVATARGLARMYGAIANGGTIDRTHFLSPEVVSQLTGRRSFQLDHSVFVPMGFHLGYHTLPAPKSLAGFGHAGLGGSVGWADPATGIGIGFVHNRLHIATVIDHLAFAGLYMLVRRGVVNARKHQFTEVPRFGAPFTEPHASAS